MMQKLIAGMMQHMSEDGVVIEGSSDLVSVDDVAGSGKLICS